MANSQTPQDDPPPEPNSPIAREGMFANGIWIGGGGSRWELALGADGLARLAGDRAGYSAPLDVAPSPDDKPASARAFAMSASMMTLLASSYSGRLAGRRWACRRFSAA